LLFLKIKFLVSHLFESVLFATLFKSILLYLHLFVLLFQSAIYWRYPILYFVYHFLSFSLIMNINIKLVTCYRGHWFYFVFIYIFHKFGW
jgi:hypothetical protein